MDLGSATAHRKIILGQPKDIHEKKDESRQEQMVSSAYGELLKDMNNQINDSDEDIKEKADKDSSEEVIIIQDAEIVDEKDVEMMEGTYDEGPKFKSGDVAQMLGISDQAVRNAVQFFGELLGEVERTESGHRLYTKRHVEILREILDFKKRHNYNNEQTLKAYKYDKLNDIGSDVKFDLMQDKYKELIRAITADVVKEYSYLLIETEKGRDNAVIEQIDKIREEQEKVNKELLDTIEEKNRIIEELLAQNKQQEEIIERVVEEKNDQIISTMRELLEEKQKKKKLFPWSK